MSRVHNKSKISGLSLLKESEYTLAKCREYIMPDKLKSFDGRNPTSPCQIVQTKDGRITIQRRKICYAYQLVALDKFSGNELSRIESNKGSDSLTISHLCGVTKCCNKNHIVIERKTINDERTHCHFALSNVFMNGGIAHVGTFNLLGACPHNPVCF
jgi:hypothetical protein